VVDPRGMLFQATEKRISQGLRVLKKERIKVGDPATYSLSSTLSAKPFSFDISNILSIHRRFNTYEVEDFGTTFAAYKFSNSPACLTIVITLYSTAKSKMQFVSRETPSYSH
jgi:hypothetical protein